jgi:chorismate mutase
MRYPIEILGISIFILYQLGIIMKIKVSKLREVLKKRGLNESFLARLFSKITMSATEKEKRELEKKISDIDDKILDLLKTTPEISDEKRREIEKRLGIS